MSDRHRRRKSKPSKSVRDARKAETARIAEQIADAMKEPEPEHEPEPEQVLVPEHEQEKEQEQVLGPEQEQEQVLEPEQEQEQVLGPEQEQVLGPEPEPPGPPFVCYVCNQGAVNEPLVFRCHCMGVLNEEGIPGPIRLFHYSCLCRYMIENLIFRCTDCDQTYRDRRIKYNDPSLYGQYFCYIIKGVFLWVGMAAVIICMLLGPVYTLWNLEQYGYTNYFVYVRRALIALFVFIFMYLLISYLIVSVSIYFRGYEQWFYDPDFGHKGRYVIFRDFDGVHYAPGRTHRLNFDDQLRARLQPHDFKEPEIPIQPEWHVGARRRRPLGNF